MPQGLNPFSGLGRIESYIRWYEFRGATSSQIEKKAKARFGRRWNKVVYDTLKKAEMRKQTARNWERSGESRDIGTLTLGLGQNNAKTVRMTGRIAFSDPKLKRGKRGQERLFTFDLPRKGTKRQIARTLREKILDAFFSHYDIANKYKPDFRKRFGSLDIIDIEGV